MNSSPLSLALQIAQLIEENTERNIRAAVVLLEEHGVGSPLLDFLAHKNRSSADRRLLPPTRIGGSAGGATTSRVITKLRDVDPDKFRLLSEFETILRRGHVLATLEDVKRFGERISKDFRTRKSRKESIPPLVALLAQRPTSELESLIEFATSFGVGGDPDEYQRLARFLIKGSSGE